MTELKTVATGDKIKIHFTGTLADGEVFDSSIGKQPLEFTAGSGMVIKGFDSAVIGMKPGDYKVVTIQPEEAYGHPSDEMIATLPRSEFPENIKPARGMVLRGPSVNDMILTVKIVDFDDDTITMDGNHPLAGEVLNFEIELLEIVAPTTPPPTS